VEKVNADGWTDTGGKRYGSLRRPGRERGGRDKKRRTGGGSPGRLKKRMEGSGKKRKERNQTEKKRTRQKTVPKKELGRNRVSRKKEGVLRRPWKRGRKAVMNKKRVDNGGLRGIQ